jgi:signal transduction histidine kinase/DNA-binding response OmpR family regulator
MMEQQKAPKPQEILIVEDIPTSLQFLLTLLTEAGFLVRPASSGPLALRSVSVRQPDLILLDVKMPQMDGYQVCRRLKAMEQTRDIPVLFLSALADADDKLKGFEAGGIDYITKPFEPREVLARIRLHLRLRELTEHLEQAVDQRTQELTRANQQLEKEITERKQVEKDLKASEIRYRRLFEDSPVSLWEEDFSEGRAYYDRLCASGVTDFRRYFNDHPEEVVHCAGLVKVLDVNKATLDLFRVDNKQDLLTGLPAIFTSQSQEVFREEVINLFEGRRRFKGEVVQRTLTGEEVIVAVQYSVAPGYEESWGKVVVSLFDITERKQTEEELKRHRNHLEELVKERTAELEESNKGLEAFAYSVSHDLRAPLRHINGFMGLLQQSVGTSLDEKSRHYMDTIFKAAKKMGLLIDDLLSFSRMGLQALSLQLVDLGPLVRDIISELEPDASGRNIEWRIGNLPVVSGDAAMLRIVLSNLISNALKFTRSKPQARIEIGLHPGKDSEAVIYVRDNGAGFDMTYVDKLFGVFQRLHRLEEFEGTGIGLANVRRIIARHGGRPWAEGKIDQGATFYFSLSKTV